MATRPFFLLIGIAFIALIAWTYLGLVGSAVVVDETGGVLSAAVTDSDRSREQALTRLWHGYFYAIPNMTGLIEIRCRDGSRQRWGYVTPNLHTKIRVVGNRPCERIVEVI